MIFVNLQKRRMYVIHIVRTYQRGNRVKPMRTRISGRGGVGGGIYFVRTWDDHLLEIAQNLDVCKPQS